MASWRRKDDRRRGRRRPTDRRAQIIVLGIIGLLAVFAYFKARERTLPPVISGTATVVDGDTVSIIGTHIRLKGIDAPEWHQSCADAKGASWPCGRKAARALSDLIRGQSLACKTTGFDQYDRVLAVCALPDGTNVNAWLVRQGWAVAFGRSQPYASAEAEAKSAKRGIWQGAFTRPAQWREHERQSQ
ncbi:MAG: thermonuclease family protein [Hyphomonadaceae bacterium]|nr:thermonuclease family protein [Hyphomonadaceae bacterium]